LSGAASELCNRQTDRGPDCDSRRAADGNEGFAVTGTIHTGTIHTGTIHTGAVHTGAIRTGAIHTGAIRTGTRAERAGRRARSEVA
jgi:hypothetical protein